MTGSRSGADDPRIARLATPLLLAAWTLAAPSFADDSLQRVRRSGELRWGGDALGGAPFVFPDPLRPSEIIGFEVEVAEAVAGRLGVRARFVQGPWDKLLELCERGDLDVALNGIEATGENRRSALLSRPYFVAAQLLTVRRGDGQAPRSLAEIRGRAAGTLPGSTAERLLSSAGADVRTYEGGQNEIYDDLRLGRLDAVLLDQPITRFYAELEPALDVVETPQGEVRYVIALRRGDGTLQVAVDAALEGLIADGTLRGIYERWGLWNPKTAQLFSDPVPAPRQAATAFERWRQSLAPETSFWKRIGDRYLGMSGLFARGAALSLALSVCAMLLAMAAGTVLALGKTYGQRPIRLLASGYIEAVRGTPLLVQLILIYFGLPEIGLKLDPFVAGWLALGLNYAAAEAENYRAGLLSVPHGQVEAARVLGLSAWQTLRRVVGPQAVRVSVPPMTNDFIALLKDSSLVSIVTLTELTKTYVNLANATRDHLGLGVVVAAWYLAIGLPFAALSRRAEARLGRHLRTARA